MKKSTAKTSPKTAPTAVARPRKSRTWDGSPETEKDKRFFDLRESGWMGPIDQDGNKVEDHEAWMNRHRP